MISKTAPNSKLHVISRAGQWAITRQGASRVSKIVPTCEAAVKEARRIASVRVEIIVHRRDGTVAERIANGIATIH
jgi:hypothetical protein